MHRFDVKDFLATIGEGRTFLPVPKRQTIYAQGTACAAVFYIQTGKVRLTVVAKNGKEAAHTCVTQLKRLVSSYKTSHGAVPPPFGASSSSSGQRPWSM
jgi:hypothetical protein